MPAARKKSERKKAPFLSVVKGSSPAEEREARLKDGATVAILGGSSAEIRDKEGHLLVRYEDGHALIAAPAGDLRLTAPTGRVVIDAADGIELSAPKDIAIKAGEVARVEAARAEICSGDSRISGGDVTIAAERFFTKVRVLTQQADRMELSAGRILERAREAYRHVEEVLQTRAGRVRAVVEDAYHLKAKRTSIVSKEDTTIDGKKVLLG